MSKLYLLLGLFAFMMSLTMTVWAENPCLPIAEACMECGYYKGGHKVGKGLVINCVMPIVAHNKKLPNVTFSDDILQKCKAFLLKKMH